MRKIFFFLLPLIFSLQSPPKVFAVVQKWPVKLHSNSSVSLEGGESNNILFDSDVTTIYNKLTVYADADFDFSTEFELAAKSLEELEVDVFEHEASQPSPPPPPPPSPPPPPPPSPLPPPPPSPLPSPPPPPPSSLSPFYETVFPTCTLIGDTPPTILVPFGDYDGNGLLDVIELSEDKTKISVRLQTSARTFASETTILISGLSGEKVLRPESVGDFTNDGKEDIVLLGGGTTWGKNRGSGDVFYASNPSSWLPWTVSEQSNTKWGNRMATGDFNGDGWLDIVTNNIYFSDLNDVYTNTKATASIGVQVNSLANTGTFSHDVTVGDMDGDSNLDLIFASSDGGGDYVIYGDGNGNFGDKWRFDGGSRGALVACDFDGDGRLDVATGDFYSALKVHYTAGASSYTRTSLFSSSSTVAEAGNRIYGMACADVNHDGWTDLIVSGAKVSVFINQGYKGESNYIVKDGQQVIFNPNPAWASPHMTLKDMDGDGSLDLVTPWHICWNNAGN